MMLCGDDLKIGQYGEFKDDKKIEKIKDHTKFY